MHLHFPWYITAGFWMFIGGFLTYQFLKITDGLPQDEKEDEEDDDEGNDDRSEKTIQRSVRKVEQEKPRDFGKNGVHLSESEWEQIKKNRPDLAELDK